MSFQTRFTIQVRQRAVLALPHFGGEHDPEGVTRENSAASPGIVPTRIGADCLFVPNPIPVAVAELPRWTVRQRGNGDAPAGQRQQLTATPFEGGVMS
jgi:hypothetical protein